MRISQPEWEIAMHFEDIHYSLNYHPVWYPLFLQLLFSFQRVINSSLITQTRKQTNKSFWHEEGKKNPINKQTPSPPAMTRGCKLKIKY